MGQNGWKQRSELATEKHKVGNSQYNQEHGTTQEIIYGWYNHPHETRQDKQMGKHILGLLIKNTLWTLRH